MTSTSISQQFQSLRAKGQCALIPFITAGDPDLETTAQALKILDANGADFIELGVPYSDPLADGPIIQAAATRALNKGTKLGQVLDLVEKISPTLKAPIILFTYYNPILNLGVRRFMEEVAGCGVKGLVVPDLPVEESAEILEIAESVGVEMTLLVTPTSSKERIEMIARQSRGFIYLVSVTGVTGMRAQIQTRVKDVLKEIRNVTDKPVGVGFGISDAEQAHQMMSWGADGVIVGSAFVNKLAQGAKQQTQQQGLEAVKDFCRDLKTSISTVSVLL
jgi:tryptophan synthase alpha chain